MGSDDLAERLSRCAAATKRQPRSLPFGEVLSLVDLVPALRLSVAAGLGHEAGGTRNFEPVGSTKKAVALG